MLRCLGFTMEVKGHRLEDTRQEIMGCEFRDDVLPRRPYRQTDENDYNGWVYPSGVRLRLRQRELNHQLPDDD